MGGLDRETTSTYLLHLEVSDGGIDGVNVLTYSATVNISVLDVNEFSPAFIDGPVYQVTVLEEEISSNVFTVSIDTVSSSSGAIRCWVVCNELPPVVSVLYPSLLPPHSPIVTTLLCSPSI